MHSSHVSNLNTDMASRLYVFLNITLRQEAVNLDMVWCYSDLKI